MGKLIRKVTIIIKLEAKPIRGSLKLSSSSRTDVSSKHHRLQKKRAMSMMNLRINHRFIVRLKNLLYD